MGAKTKRVLLVFRKANTGNYSIETVYNCLYDYWHSETDSSLQIGRYYLKRTFDLVAWITCLLKSPFRTNTVAHITGGANYMILAFPFQKRIITIHDFFYLKSESPQKSRWYTLLFYTWPIAFSHKIVVVSQATYNDLVERYPKAKNKAVIIPNPLEYIDNGPAKARKSPPELPVKILQIGNKPLKNYARLIEACQDLPVEILFVHGTTGPIERLLSKYQFKDKATVYSNLDRKALIDLYHKADILYFASLAEGFGLPLLEARAVMLPILTSDLEPMKSLAPGAFLVNPSRTQEIRKALEQFIAHGSDQAVLKSAKYSLVEFSPGNIAKKYQQVYMDS